MANGPSAKKPKTAAAVAFCGVMSALSLLLLLLTAVPVTEISLAALAGLTAGTLSQYALRRSFVGCLVCSAACLAMMELFRLVSGVITQLGPLPALLSVAAGELLLSLCWTPAVYFIFSRVYRRVGGQKLA